MKKIFTIILTLFVITAFVACGSKENKKNETNTETIGEVAETNENIATGTENSEGEKETVSEDKTDGTVENAATEKESAAQTQKPNNKPQEQQKPAASTNPEIKPETNTETKPEEKPAQTPPADTSTLGKTLLADFNSKAAAGMSVDAIAEALLKNPAIKFSGGSMPIEEGLLAGFDNTEIKGFKNGAVFMPMIGSIPFVGYIFELENAADAPAFIANLKKAANPRWNICVEADETVTGSVGNKVFFVMCPTSLEE